MFKRKHWLYGPVKLQVVVDVEHDCTKCAHNMTCRHDMYAFCSNYRFGNSNQPIGCGGCTHRFSKWDKEPIPCFHCRYFIETTDETPA